MNYWKTRKGSQPKSTEEKDEWMNLAKKLFLHDKSFDFLLLQEASIKIIENKSIQIKKIGEDNSIIFDYNRNKYIYHTNPFKYSDWGLMIRTPRIKCERFMYNNTLAYMCYDLTIRNKDITIINVHVQKDYETKLYYPALKKLIAELRAIIKSKNNLVIMAGDFNSSSFFDSDEKNVFKSIFNEIEDMGFIDCTKNIDLADRSTMIDYPYQNVYVFINKPFVNNVKELVIRKDIQNDLIDHFPIDFKIEV
jgi:endonuclease/exonuclease/phosphatase family metal-dependent hydrolase